MTAARDVRFWDRLAPKYAKRPVSDPAAYEAKLTRLSALLQPTDRVLELGCGTGTTALRLAAQAATITATDVSGGMLDIAEGKRVAQGIDTVRFIRADAADTVDGAPFDVIMTFSLLHLVDDLSAVLAAVHAQLKPGGLFVSKTVCLGDHHAGLRLLVRAMQVVGLAPHVAFVRAADFEDAIARGGFGIEETAYFDTKRMTPFIVARKPAAP